MPLTKIPRCRCDHFLTYDFVFLDDIYTLPRPTTPFFPIHRPWFPINLVCVPPKRLCHMRATHLWQRQLAICSCVSLLQPLARRTVLSHVNAKPWSISRPRDLMLACPFADLLFLLFPCLQIAHMVVARQPNPNGVQVKSLKHGVPWYLPS